MQLRRRRFKNQGEGALPNLVCAALKDRGDLGIHTEALCPRGSWT